MKKAIFGVYGASGCGRGIMPLARDFLQQQGMADQDLYFVDDAPPADMLNGQQVIDYRAFLEQEASERHLVLAVANSEVRERLALKMEQDGVSPWAVKASNVVMMDDVRLGPGSVLSPFVTLTSNIRIGKYFHANLYSYVEHDSVIGDYVTFAPGVKCNGNVIIEDHAYLGAGAIIRQGVPGDPIVIGRGATVGMGAVVTKSVPPGVTVAGNPARLLQKS